MINLNSENVLFVNHYGECGVSNINQIFCCAIILTYFDAKCQGIYNKNHLQNYSFLSSIILPQNAFYKVYVQEL